jgi:hypothetical protein
MSEDIQVDYLIDGDFAKLTDISDKICCKQCNRVLALVNRDSIMIKTQITIVKKDEKSYVLRCGHCKTFNTITQDGQLLAV